jgi:predicted N-acetyltransferase YhbS
LPPANPTCSPARGHPAARVTDGDRSSVVRLVDERVEHAPAVERLLDAAFGEGRWHKTCQRLRDGQTPSRGLSLVALDRDALVGTVRLWPVQMGRRRAFARAAPSISR